MFEFTTWHASFADFFIKLQHYTVIGKQLFISKDRNRVCWVVLGLLQDGACTDLVENLSVNSLKGDLLNVPLYPALFSLVNTFNQRHNRSDPDPEHRKEITCFVDQLFSIGPFYVYLKKAQFVSWFPIGQDSIPAHMAANLRTGNLSGGTPDFAAGHQDVKQVGQRVSAALMLYNYKFPSSSHLKRKITPEFSFAFWLRCWTVF